MTAGKGASPSRFVAALLALALAVALERSHGSLLAGGGFNLGATGIGIAEWTGFGWEGTLGRGLNDQVRAMAVYRNETLVVGGWFTADVDATAQLNYVARWSGEAWQPMAGGMDSFVLALADYRGALYAGGAFTVADGKNASRLARWAESDSEPGAAGTWEALDRTAVSGGVITALTVWNDQLYVGGDFTSVDGVSLDQNFIASWDGSAWSSIGGGVTQGTRVRALVPFASRLYIGGQFSRVGTVGAYNVASWNPATQSFAALGAGLSAEARAMVGYGNSLVVGGSFSNAGTIAARNIAQWASLSTWIAVGAGLDGPVNSLVVTSGIVIAAGEFEETYDGAIPLARVAQWNGRLWAAVGTGFNNEVATLMLYNPVAAPAPTTPAPTATVSPSATPTPTATGTLTPTPTPTQDFTEAPVANEPLLEVWAVAAVSVACTLGAVLAVLGLVAWIRFRRSRKVGQAASQGNYTQIVND